MKSKSRLLFWICFLALHFASYSQGALSLHGRSSFKHDNPAIWKTPLCLSLTGYTDVARIRGFAEETIDEEGEVDVTAEEDNPVTVKISKISAIRLSCNDPADYEGKIAYIICTACNKKFLKYQYIIKRRHLVSSESSVHDVFIAKAREAGVGFSVERHIDSPAIRFKGDSLQITQMLKGMEINELPVRIIPVWITLKIDGANVVYNSENKELIVRAMHHFQYKVIEYQCFKAS